MMASRHFGRAIRQFSADASAKAAHDHEASARLWQNLSLFVAIPTVLVTMINVGLHEREHLQHLERPEFIKYDHLRIHTRDFPWRDGKKSLFYNKRVNALPDGYED